jgi:hypothetical protein
MRFSVPTAQVDAWAAVHQGNLDDTATEIDKSLIDSALGRMMLHRRRALASQVIEEFFASAGSRFVPYLGDQASTRLLTFASEMAEANAAAAVAERVGGSTMPLLVERASMAETEGRVHDAVADLERLLEAYPGFVTAALAAGRLAFADGDPLRAIDALACVHRELIETREGAGLLADVLREIGVPEAASRYDVAALIGLGYMDSRGNDFAPVDAAGNVVSHNRMLPAFYVDHLPDGHVLYNDRGVYYSTNSTIGDLLFSIFRSCTADGSRVRRRRARSPDGLVAFRFLRRLKLGAYKKAPLGKVLSVVPIAFLRAWRKLSWLRRAIDRSLRGALPQIAAWGLLEIPERDRHSPIVQARVRSGITAIFGSRLALIGDPRRGTSELRGAANGETNVSSDPPQKHDENSVEAQLQRVFQMGVLSPIAFQALRRLVSRLDVGPDETLRL